MRNLLVLSGLFFAAAMLGSCSRGPLGGVCIETVDLGGPGVQANTWCDGGVPPLLDGECGWRSFVCLPPEEDGHCRTCPEEEVVAEVYDEVERLASDIGFPVSHWEFGCLQDPERSKASGHDEDYCCYRVLVWYEGRGSPCYGG